MKRLGSSCFLPPLLSGDPEVVLKLFPTITRDLADFDTAWRNSLSRTVGVRAIQRTASLQEQFDKFMFLPATGSENAPVYFGPMLIVVDGLEQCGSEGSQERRELLSILSTKLTKLPANFRILITTRPSPDISRMLCREGTNIEHWDLHNEIEDKQTAEDITAFLDAELRPVFRGRWPEYREKLANKLERNFSSAALACDAIKQEANPVDYITHLLQRSDEGGWNAAAFRQSISQHIPFLSTREPQRGPPAPLLSANQANRPPLLRQPTDFIPQPPKRISSDDSTPLTPALSDQGSVGMPSPDSEFFDSAPSGSLLFPQPHFDEPMSYEGDDLIQPGKPIGMPFGSNSYAMSGDDVTGYTPSFPDPKPHNPPVYRTSDPHWRPTPPMRVLRAPLTTHSSAASSLGGWA
ncbi:unnamed protein product [Mycena citricolor]|uniref:NACHT domain-containing protein n=1 Tax=Mycena citricolor TaxID=2018698 RepID=A0AAD2H793_9AGAR|nr:unnamed protein product [Mycena citricolor]